MAKEFMIFRKVIFLLSAPFSFLYFLIISIRNILYNVNIFRKYKINAKVISVGNITWGGTGKTPVVAFIADLLARKGHNVSILIRGYGNDESELLPKLTSNVPVLAGKDRVKKGLEAIEKNLSDTILMDDGFQHRRLRRDLDIVCIDAVRPFGNGWLIPAGSLRERVGCLKRADIFLITKADLVGDGRDRPLQDKDSLARLKKRLRKINPKAIIAKAIHRPLYFYRLSNIVGDGLKPSPTNGEKVHPVRDSLPKMSYQGISNGVNIGELQNKELVLVSAIGSPGCFEKTILRLGLKVNKHFVFRDHHLYTKNDLAYVEDYCKKNKLDTVVTTEKDAVKLRNPVHPAGGLRPPTGWTGQYMVLKVRLEIIENEDGFYNRLFRIYSS